MSGNPYITYIEKVYLEKCRKSGDGAGIEADWQSKKLLYKEMTKTTVYEFMNYSMHDESHSINILESIEMLLGRERINRLSRSDLWLILNVAYAHDIGMVSEYKNLEELWSNPEFQEYIQDAMNSLDRDEARAAKLYKVLDGLLSAYCEDDVFEKVTEKEFEYYNAWPLEIRKDVTLLMSNFIRKEHGELSQEFFKTPEKLNNYTVCDRLFQLIGRISACHTESQESLESLPQRCKGFGVDRMHPQFVATLLRLGDLLDLDNNRFDIFSMKHFGPLPEISVLNYKKHKSITHFHIEPKVIEVTAQSDEFDVCKLNYAWFQYLKNDIIYLITHWSEMAPNSLKGCLLGVPKLEVKHGKYQFYDNSNQGFILEKAKLLKLFTGNNLYSSDLDFIREYIQNAFDASKLQLFYEIKASGSKLHSSSLSKTNLYLKDKDISLENIKPFDLTETAYKAFPIILELSADKNEDGFILRITDKGIGIDKEGINAITNVGLGWRKRKNHAKAISKMRKWLRPTGGFGIGMQSAFLCTDTVNIYTKSAFEEGYRIILTDSSNEKNVFVEVDTDNLHQGTTVEFRIKFSAFDKPDILNKYLKKSIQESADIDKFSLQGKMKIVKAIIEEYLRINFPTSLFPIELLVGKENEYIGTETEVLISSIVYNCDENKKKDKWEMEVPEYRNYLSEEIGSESDNFYKYLGAVVNNSKKFWVNVESTCMRVWDDDKQVFYHFRKPLKTDENVNIRANYKNVLVKDNTRTVALTNTKHSEFIEISYDIMGVSVEDCLIVSRNGFAKTFNNEFDVLLDGLTNVYIKILLDKLDGSPESQLPNKILINSVLINEKEVDGSNIIKKYKEQLENEILEAWRFLEGEEGKFKIKKEFVSGKNLFDTETNFIWMAQINSQEELPKELLEKTYYHCSLVMNNDKMVICIKDEEDSIAEMKGDEWENIRILCDKKYCAILSKYRKSEKDVIFDFKYLGLERDFPLKAYFWGKTGKKSYGFVKKITGKSEKNQKEENDITPSSFNRTYKIVQNPIVEEFASLVVNRIPYSENEMGKYYIISPYTKEIGMKYDKMNRENGKVKFDYVMSWVEKDSSYEELCQWVYKHQKEKSKYTVSQIREAYKELVRQDVMKINKK